MTTAQLARLENATVSIPRLEGRGVLVPGGLIITAAHCIPHRITNRMTIGDSHPVAVKTPRGLIVAEVYALEPMSDVAVLGRRDVQKYVEDAAAYDDFCENAEPISICHTNWKLNTQVRAFVLGLDRSWIQGDAKEPSHDAGTFCLTARESIRGGMSGVPIVTSAGSLIGVVSEGGGKDEDTSFDGTMPRLSRALPAWVLMHIAAHQKALNVRA